MQRHLIHIIANTPRVKTLFTFITFVTLLTLSSACNKSEPLTTPADILAGKWRLVQTATDDNNNKILDPAEIRTMDANDLVTYSFHYGGAGVEEVDYYGTITDYYFTWNILGNSQFLQMFMEGHDSITRRILTFSPANTNLLDTTGVVYAWYVLQKY